MPTIVEQAAFSSAFSSLYSSTAYQQGNPFNQQQQVKSLLESLGAIKEYMATMTQQALESLLESIRSFAYAPITDLTAWFYAWWLDTFGMSPWPAAGTEG